MDRLEALGNTLSQISLYDIKTMYNQAKNVVLNVTEMEAKVKEATNDDAWGASSTLMQEIAQGTFNFQQFNEIMPCIYAQVMEKEARQWRQIYKSLQLLEYLIRHGSERVVDDARSHISTLKMLRNFHYIDNKGKDEGINVRNRSRELVEFLSDVEKIRSERRKAKANKHKYIGAGNDGMTFGSGRYSGFGSDSLHGSDWSGGGSGSYDRDRNGGFSGGFRDDRRGFEEYNAGEDEISVRRSTSLRNLDQTRSSSGPASSASRQNAKAKEEDAAPAPAPAPEASLLDLLDDDTFSANLGMLATNKDLPAVKSNDDDEFADFQAAPVTQNTQPTNLMALLNASSARPTAAPYTQPTYNMQPMQPASQPMSTMFGAGIPNRAFTAAAPVTMASPAPGRFGAAPLNPAPAPVQRNMTQAPSGPAAKPSTNFDDLWSMSLGSGTTSTTVASGGKSIKDLEKEKANTGLWGRNGGWKPGTGSTLAQSSGDDLLL